MAGTIPSMGKISIHALRGEGDTTLQDYSTTVEIFLSTPSVGRATVPLKLAAVHLQKFLSTPSVGRATHLGNNVRKLHTISIHALRGEGDKTTLPP